MRQIFKLLRDRKGQAMVEFALVLPILLLILLGIVDFGRILNEHLTVTAAAREGARSAAVMNTDATVTGVVQQAASSLKTDGNPLTITISPSPARVSGSPVTVEVKHDVEILTPFMREVLPDPFHVKGTATMQVE